MSKRPVYGALQVYMLLRVPMYSVAMSRGLELLNGKIAYAENTFSETEKSVCVPSLLERTIVFAICITCKCKVCVYFCVLYTSVLCISCVQEYMQFAVEWNRLILSRSIYTMCASMRACSYTLCELKTRDRSHCKK